MKIIYYSPHPNLNLASPSGYGTHMREMIAAFRELGHEVHPVIMGGTSLENESGDIPRPGLLKRTIKAFIPAFLWESLKDLRLLSFDQNARKLLKKQVLKFKPDLIYERANYCQLSGVETAIKYRVPHILEVNAPYVEEREKLQGPSAYLAKARQMEGQQLRKTGKVVVVSSPLKEYYMKRHGLPGNRFLVTPNCVSPASVRSIPEVLESIKQKYGLGNQYVVGFVGSIQPWHGVDVLINAYAQFASEAEVECRLLIVGDGWDLPNLKELTKRMGIEKQVIFTGNVPFREVFSYMDVMDLTVLAKTAWYCSPVKIFEYGAMKKPIVAMDTASVREVMEHKRDGLLVDAEVSDLAEALAQLQGNKLEAEALAKHFHQKVMTRFIWVRTAEKILSQIPK